MATRTSPPGPADLSRPGRRGGRPSKLTDELERDLCRHLRAGVRLRDAVFLVGASPSTVHGWLAEGRRLDGRPRLQQFAAAVEGTRSQSTLLAYDTLQRAIRAGKWRAAAYLLERRFPGDWKLEWRYDRHGRPVGRCQVEREPRRDGVGPGRLPPRLTPEVETKLATAFRLGAFPQEAATYAGISRSTLYRWRAAASHPQAHPRLKELERELRGAEAEVALEAVFTIHRAGAAGQWRASAWLLERIEPEQFGSVDRFGRRPTNPAPS